MCCVGISSTDDRPFAAHVTIAKLSKMRGKGKSRGKGKKGSPKLRKIPEASPQLACRALQSLPVLLYKRSVKPLIVPSLVICRALTSCDSDDKENNSEKKPRNKLEKNPKKKLPDLQSSIRRLHAKPSWAHTTGQQTCCR